MKMRFSKTIPVRTVSEMHVGLTLACRKRAISIFVVCRFTHAAEYSVLGSHHVQPGLSVECILGRFHAVQCFCLRSLVFEL